MRYICTEQTTLFIYENRFRHRASNWTPLFQSVSVLIWAEEV